MNIIKNFPIDAPETVVEIPFNAVVLSITNMGKDAPLGMWVQLDPTLPVVERTFTVISCNEEFDENIWFYTATLTVDEPENQCSYIFHVFERLLS